MIVAEFVDERHPGGRPLKFASVEELENRIQEYFAYCDSRIVKQLTKSGDIVDVNVKRPYTLSGLAVFLDCNRQTLLNYSKDEKFFGTIARAREKCENFAEEQLYEGNDRGAKFCLLNGYGWVDKQEISSTVNATITGQVDLARLSAEELATLETMLAKATETE